jgi:hypothetical protein
MGRVIRWTPERTGVRCDHVSTEDVAGLEAQYRELVGSNADGEAWLSFAMATLVAMVAVQRHVLAQREEASQDGAPGRWIAPSQLLDRLHSLQLLIHCKLVDLQIVVDDRPN